MSSFDYFKYRDTVHLEPILNPTKVDAGIEYLLLLVLKGQSLSTIRQKGERFLILEAGANGVLSKIWLDTLLHNSGYAQIDQFFTKIKQVGKSSRAVLPVFFKQADACVVTRQALKMIQELNPQIGKQVTLIDQSEGLVRLSRNLIDRFVGYTTNETSTAATWVATTAFRGISGLDLIRIVTVVSWCISGIIRIWIVTAAVV